MEATTKQVRKIVRNIANELGVQIYETYTDKFMNAPPGYDRRRVAFAIGNDTVGEAIERRLQETLFLAGLINKSKVTYADNTKRWSPGYTYLRVQARFG
jgi:hypothetical protein